MKYNEIISSELKVASELLERFLANPNNLQKIEESGLLMSQSVKHGGKILSCGNGGSCCDAMHFAEELTGRYREDRKAIPAISISDPSHMSCVGNDYGYEQVFSRYLEAVGNQGDVLLAISTSGNSENVLKAIEVARAKGLKVVILTGKDGGKMTGLGDVEICVSHFGFADRIQEIHIKIIHLLIFIIEKELE